MQTVKVNASRSYEICIGAGILTTLPKSLTDRICGKRVMIVSDDTVYSLHAGRIEKLLKENGIRTESFVFPHGEVSKNLYTYQRLVESMSAASMSRQDIIIAVGGGVVGDLAGFAAASYQRGIDYIQIPTTLLAAVDSSVGGKTGLDLEGGKNQIGAVFQPMQVLCDTDMLKTLPEDEYINGCAEIIKYAMIGNAQLLRSIRRMPVYEQYETVITACVSMKRDLVEKDEYDHGARMLLNFGHTVGHAVETCSRYTVPHGKAVAVGMAVITKAAAEFGFCEGSVYDELIELLKQYGLPSETGYTADSMEPVIMNDKKRQGDSITMIVPLKAGVCSMTELPEDSVAAWLKAGGLQ